MCGFLFNHLPASFLSEQLKQLVSDGKGETTGKGLQGAPADSRAVSSITHVGKAPDAGKDSGQEKKGVTEDGMVGWHHQLNGHEFEKTPGDGEGQGSLMCCSSWGHRVGHNLVTGQ